MDKVMVETGRIRTHCFVSGPSDGVPVLLVHGNITTGRFWQDVADGFPGGYRLVAPDLRSFGRTERKPVDATPGACGTGATTCTPWWRRSAGLQPPGGDADLLLVAELPGARRGRADGRGAPDRLRRHRLPGRPDHLAQLARVGPGSSGVNNAFSGKWCDTSAFADLRDLLLEHVKSAA